MVDAQPAPEPRGRRCPRCGTDSVHRSHGRNAFERAIKAVGLRAYRCTTCSWRGYRFKRRAWDENGPATAAVSAAIVEAAAPEAAPRRRHKSRTEDRAARRARRASLVALAVACALGAAMGLALYSCDQPLRAPPEIE